MPNAINRQVLENGAQNYVVKFTIIGDGSGEETGTIVNAVSGDMGTNAKILRITGALQSFSARLLFDATTDVFAFQLPDASSGSDFNYDFSKFGGLVNDGGTGKTGDILITTTGLGSGDSGSFVMWCKKN